MEDASMWQGGARARFGAGIVGRFKPARSRVVRTAAEWRALLSAEQFRILREHGTETPCCSPFEKSREHGTYQCAGCNQPLFSSTAKYDSGSGWPSFSAPLEESTATSTDFRLLLPRTEVHCSCCDGHLGHVFKDGPAPSGLRYCINGTALVFVAEE
jgi:peptide-methionine (R)-S-oxide reductase